MRRVAIEDLHPVENKRVAPIPNHASIIQRRDLHGTLSRNFFVMTMKGAHTDQVQTSTLKFFHPNYLGR